jgi:adenylate cyclase
MTEEAQSRRLSAIVAADVVGYSQLMEKDESGTLAQLQATLRDVVGPKIEAHRGRIVKTTGDGFLAEFASVSDAMQSAVEIQQTMASHNAAIAEEDRIQFRMGINLGEIITEGGDIYGRGVNVASRLESIAEPGGICISASVHDQIQSLGSLRFEDLGDQSVKNISRPVRSYAVKLAATPQEPTAAKAGSAEHTDLPSIAVLPFDNMSEDPEQEHFADGMTEDIITALSKISGLLVIARNSSFVFKGKALDVQTVGKELGVRNVLEGSVRKVGPHVRISVQLVDTKTREHIWAARFDRELADIFALQDDITSNVVTALQVRLVEGEQARAWRKSTTDLSAWECFVQALAHFRRFTREDNARARSLFERATQLDPNYASALVWLAWTYWSDARFLWSEDAREALSKAVELKDRALALDSVLADAYGLSGAIHLAQGSFEKAIANGRRAVELEPSGADATALYARTLNWCGEPEEAASLIRKAMRLSPVHPPWYASVFAHACWLMGDQAKAAGIYSEAVEQNPEQIGPHIGLALCLAELGQEDEAGAEAQAILEISPDFTIARYAEKLTYRYPEPARRSVDALRKAGLPEGLAHDANVIPLKRPA